MRGRIAGARTLIAGTGLALLLGGCNGADQGSADTASQLAGTKDQRGAAANESMALDAGSANPQPAGQSVGNSSERTLTTPLAREVIATAQVTIRVDDVAATLPDLMRAATSTGGYVAGEDTSSDPDDPSKTRSTLVLRVPTASLQKVVDEVSGLGDVLRSQQDVEDVTEQVVDVKSRLETAKASVARIRVLLDQATTLAEVVRIESQLSRREADLESLLATQRLLADQTELATLTVTTLGPQAAQPAVAVDEEDGFVAGLDRGWNAFVDVVVLALTVIGVLLPFAIAAGLVLFPLWLIWRRRQPKYNTVIEPAN